MQIEYSSTGPSPKRRSQGNDSEPTKITKKGERKKAGTIGNIGTTSFFPSKNLGCYGDGGAIFTNNDGLAEKIRMIVNHGESKKYHHKLIGCNSRLDSIQAVILNIKLKYLDDYNSTRRIMADNYNMAFKNIASIKTTIKIDSSNCLLDT